jgi:hypothetical protein
MHPSRHTGSRALITPPTAAVMTLDACKAALGITGTDKDAIIAGALNATVAQLDPAEGGWLGRALRPQTWELRLPGFVDHGCGHPHYGAGAIALPYPKLISIESFKYDDAGGTERTLVLDTDFRILGAGTFGKQAVAPLYNRCWPVARCDAETVRIRFRSGYAAAVPADPGPEAADELPASIPQAIALGVRMLISNTGANLYLSMDRTEGIGEKRYTVTSAANELLQTAMQNLLSICRVYG